MCKIATEFFKHHKAAVFTYRKSLHLPPVWIMIILEFFKQTPQLYWGYVLVKGCVYEEKNCGIYIRMVW